ncbi:hypothetical protein [Nonomuraea turkmeniaca]|uniref:hypothetical protein n=1 Tax=Nonomuraea turkmeniaca TaxID=103838 RepID=UPI00147785DB|nr:hypothetical protein [Nonomuraea turkmeniaca]
MMVVAAALIAQQIPAHTTKPCFRAGHHHAAVGFHDDLIRASIEADIAPRVSALLAEASNHRLTPVEGGVVCPGHP